MGEMDTKALDLVLAQLNDRGRGALKHLLANAIQALALDIEPGLEIDHEIANETVARITAMAKACRPGG